MLPNEEKKPEFNPTWRYHRTLEAKIIYSQEQLDALGPGWETTPAAFESDQEVEAPKKRGRKPRGEA